MCKSLLKLQVRQSKQQNKSIKMIKNDHEQFIYIIFILYWH